MLVVSILFAACAPSDDANAEAAGSAAGPRDGGPGNTGDIVTPNPPARSPAAEALEAYEGGTVLTATIASAYADGRVGYHLWLPHDYASLAGRIPILVMLHGLGPGLDSDHWLNLGLAERLSVGVAEGRYPPMGIVLPEGNSVDYIKDAAPIPQIIVEEIVPHLEAALPVGGSPELRAIGGLSRGGYWAVATALLYPRVFSRVGSHSGYFYPNTEAPHLNPSVLLTEAEGLVETEFYFDVAEDDPTAWRTFDFVEALQARIGAAAGEAAAPGAGGYDASADAAAARGAAADPESEPAPGAGPDAAAGTGVIFEPALTGGHSDEYWARRIPDYLQFYSEAWSR